MIPRNALSVFPDLHFHSNFSDGLFSPLALCQMAQLKGLTHISLCDHNTMAGTHPMKKALAALAPSDDCPLPRLLPGVEISTGPHGNLHILGYGARAENPLLSRWMAESREIRLERFSQMLRKLSGLGIHVPSEFLPPMDTNLPLGRAHLARALVAMKLFPDIEAAFHAYLKEGQPAYVPNEHISSAEAIDRLRRADCVPVLAHPAKLALEPPALFALLHSLQQNGLMGVEVYHPSISLRDIPPLDAFARRQGLLITGGSDYHGDSNNLLGTLPAGWRDAGRDINRLLAAMSIHS